MKHEVYASIYDAGIAVGDSNIKNDTMTFRFKSEVFELPARCFHGLDLWNGYFYEIPIDKLRELERQQTEK